MPAADPNTRAHLEWLGFIQPHGLVVSPPALLKAGAFVNRQDTHRQALLAGCTEERALAPNRQPIACIRDFREFAAAVLGWRFSPRGYAGFTEEAPIPEELTLPLPDYGETLRPDFAVRERDPGSGDSPWQLLVQVLAAGQEFDRPARGGGATGAAAATWTAPAGAAAARNTCCRSIRRAVCPRRWRHLTLGLELGRQAARR